MSRRRSDLCRSASRRVTCETDPCQLAPVMCGKIPHIRGLVAFPTCAAGALALRWAEGREQSVSPSHPHLPLPYAPLALAAQAVRRPGACVTGARAPRSSAARRAAALAACAPPQLKPSPYHRRSMGFPSGRKRVLIGSINPPLMAQPKRDPRLKSRLFK